jgi:hypothetical protein
VDRGRRNRCGRHAMTLCRPRQRRRPRCRIGLDVGLLQRRRSCVFWPRRTARPALVCQSAAISKALLLGSSLAEWSPNGPFAMRKSWDHAVTSTNGYPRTVSPTLTGVLGAPAMYARFRRQMMREGRHFLTNEAAIDFVNRNMVSPDEVDVMLLVMLRNARRVLRRVEGRHDSAVQYDWLETLGGRYMTQVFVDEATDLSAFQLACTIELSNPGLRSWFACGDLRQRVTATGIQHEEEIEWLNRTTGVQVDIRKIDIGFRQGRRLREFSDALAGLLDMDSQRTKSPSETEEADAWPLLAEHLSGLDLGQWLAARPRREFVARQIDC